MRRAALAWGVFAATAGLAALSVVLIALSPEAPILDASFAFRGYDAVFAITYGVVGVLIASRRPSHPIGWLFLLAAILSGVQTVANEYAEFAAARGLEEQTRLLVYWFAGWIWLPGLAAIQLVLLLFPTGRPASPRWRPVIAAVVLSSLAVMVLWAVAPPADEPEVIPFDPLGLGPAAPLRELAETSLLLLAAGFVAGFLSLIARMRAGSFVERQQIKWLALAAILVGTGFVLMLLTLRADPALAELAQFAAIVAVVLIPVATGLAILRHRLYDIDLLINRTLVYAGLTATLALAYAAFVVLLQQLTRPLTQGSDLAVAGSTLAVAALFQPARRRIQSAVDRRFYRSKYDAERTIARFSARVRAEVDLDALQGELGAVVRETMRPAHLSLWLREGGSGAVTLPERRAATPMTT